MEPLFFKAENGSFGRLPPQSGAASMEPLFFKAENAPRSVNIVGSSLSFNGAAFFQSGKPDAPG